jgi:phage-related protein
MTNKFKAIQDAVSDAKNNKEPSTLSTITKAGGGLLAPAGAVIDAASNVAESIGNGVGDMMHDLAQGITSAVRSDETVVEQMTQMKKHSAALGIRG